MALQARHAQGKVVKVRPSRLCLTNSGRLVMCESRGRQAEYEDKLYASPEELLSKPLSMASDLYSLVSPPPQTTSTTSSPGSLFINDALSKCLASAVSRSWYGCWHGPCCALQMPFFL